MKFTELEDVPFETSNQWAENVWVVDMNPSYCGENPLVDGWNGNGLIIETPMREGLVCHFILVDKNHDDGLNNCMSNYRNVLGVLRSRQEKSKWVVEEISKSEYAKIEYLLDEIEDPI